MLRFLNCFNGVNEWVNRDETKHIYRTKDSYFTRSTAILTVPMLMEFILENNKGSAQVALNDYFRDTDIDPVARQSLFDVHFGEDFCCVLNKDGQQNLNIVRKIVLNHLRRFKELSKSKLPFSNIMFDCLIGPANLIPLFTFFEN